MSSSSITSTSALLKRLNSLLIRQRLVLFGAGILTTFVALLAVWLLLSLIANIIVLPVSVKIGLLAVAAATVLYFFGKFALSRLFNGNIDSIARALELKYPALKGALIAAVQFERTGVQDGFSRDLVEATHIHALRKAGDIDLARVVSFNPVFKTSRYVAISTALALGLLILFPGLFSHSFEVYSNPTDEIAPPLAYQLVASPESMEWIKYRDITIGAAITGQRIPSQAIIHHRMAGGNWQQTKLATEGLIRTAIDSGDSLLVSLTLRQVNRSFEYYVQAGKLKTDVVQITVVDRPRVNNMEISVFPPKYTGLPPTTVSENNGSFSAIVGSRVNIKIETNLPVQTAEAVFDDSSRVPLSINGKLAELSLVVDASRSYHIQLTDHLGERNPDPIEYYVTAIPDEYPTVEVLRPGYDANLSEEMVLPLLVRIADDFGFSSLVMKFSVMSQGRQSEEHVAVLHYSDKIKTEGEVEFNWDMDQLHLFPGDYVGYFFEVADNDRISGPKISRSRTYIARLPSLEEITQQAENEGQQRITQTEELLKSGKELSQRLKNAARKLSAQNRDAKKADWQQERELEAIAEKQEEMIQQIDEMARKMDESLERLQNNSLMSREIMEKMAEIQKLFEEIATPEMREAQKKLMEALQKMDRQQLQDAMKKYEMSQQELMERLERTMALLKKMQLEQKMEAMIRKAEQLAKEQESINESTESASVSQLPQLSEPQESVKQGLENLKKEIAELEELIKQAKMEQSEEAQKFKEAVEKTDAQKNMEQSSQAMKQQQKSEAGKEGKQALSKLQHMIGQMQQQQLAMQGGQNKEAERAMRQALDDANQLSQNQEQLLREAAAMQSQSDAMRDMAQTQQDLAQATEALQRTIEELGKKSPFMASELERLVQNATENMNQATSQCNNKNSAMASQAQRDAMASLNKAASRLMQSLDAQKQCNNPSSNCNSGMPKLESLAQKQNQLNQQTQGMCNNPSSQPGQGNIDAMTRDGLQRLAGEQGSIRKSLEELEKEFGNSRQVMGRLDDIGREMKKVEEDMADGEVGQETTDRQLKIFSRLLEATRSLQRKDFTEQRQANTPTTNPVFLPPGLTSDLLNDKALFEDRIRRFLGDDFPPQYQEQIKAYFRALLQTKAGGSPTPSIPVPQ